MGCACKVNKYVDRLNVQYGNKFSKTVKTNISEIVKSKIKRTFLTLLCLPIIPFMFIYAIVHKWFINKPISIDKILKLK